MSNKLLFLADYYFEDGFCRGGAERSDFTLRAKLNESLEVKRLHSDDAIGIQARFYPEEYADYRAIIISNRTRMTRDTQNTIINCGIPYYIIERDCQFVKSRNVASYKNYVAPPSQINNELFYNSADAVFSLCESHYSKMMLNLPKAKLVNLGATHLDDSEKSLFKELRLIGKKSEQRIGVPKIKDWGNAAMYARLMYPDAIIELFDTNPNREVFLRDVAAYEKIAFKPFVYESFSRFCLECKMLGCDVITEKPKDIGFFDSEFWQGWIQRGCDIDEAYGRVDESLDIVKFKII